MRKKTVMIDICAYTFIILGLIVILYPTFSNYLFEENGSYSINSYNSSVEELNEEKLNRIYEKAVDYNKELVIRQMTEDVFEESAETDEYWSLLNVDHDGVIGSLRIPEINIELPIYHGTGEEVLQKGIGHWEGTSLPVGGSSTHSVLMGHRGLASVDLFSNLDQLQKGDIFYITVLKDKLAYKIDRIKTVLPDEIDDLLIKEGEDYVTLVTCTPYATNTHRLLIRGKRVAYQEAVVEEEDVVERKLWMPPEGEKALIILVFLFVGYFIYSMRRKKKYH